MAADENYCRQMYVTLYSALKNKDEGTDYIVYLLVPEIFSQEVMDQYRDLISRYEGSCLRFIVMGGLFSDMEMTIGHIAYPTYYRLVADRIIPYDRVVYTDTDVIIRSDLSELHGLVLDDNVLAGVKAAGYHCRSGLTNRLYCNAIGLESINHYVNAGVLILNLKEFRKRSLSERMLKMVECCFPSMDQDILNVAAGSKVFDLDCSYNVMTKFSLDDGESSGYLFKVFGREAAERAYQDPKIIHYADRKKPWLYRDSMFADIWWQYCSETPFLDIMTERMNDFVNKGSEKKSRSDSQSLIGKKLEVLRNYKRIRQKRKELGL